MGGIQRMPYTREVIQKLRWYVDGGGSNGYKIVCKPDDGEEIMVCRGAADLLEVVVKEHNSRLTKDSYQRDLEKALEAALDRCKCDGAPNCEACVADSVLIQSRRQKEAKRR